MNMQSNFTAEQLAAIERVKKLMAMADHPNTNENEAANATAMANDILTRLNLSMGDLSAEQDRDSRSDTRILGGFYQHERDLWEAVAELNFCYYWTVKVRYDAERARKERRKWAHHHRLVGRSVNIISTEVMATYLLSTIERLVKEWCAANRRWEKFHPRSETAVSFRKGCTARIIEKINDRREALIREEKRKQRENETRAQHPAAVVENALVVTNLVKSEAASNYDFMHGEGAWDRRVASQAQWERDWEERERREAAEHERKMRDDPKYRREFEREQEKAEKRWERRREKAQRDFERGMGDRGAWMGGYDKGDDISLDQQVKHDPMKRIG